ncbi:MAG TPA: preprotein translocase subunit YajC [Anaeromyxobacter sp.]
MSPVLHAFLSQTAQDGKSASPFEALGTFPVFILIALIFYFVFFRPQQKQAKQHQAFLGSLKKGDEVVTQGGIVGTVVLVEDRTVTIDVGSGTKLRVVKGQIAGQWKVPEPQQAKLEAKK